MGYDGGGRQFVQTGVVVDLDLGNGLRYKDVPCLVVAMPRDILVGRIFLERNGLVADCERRRVAKKEEQPSKEQRSSQRAKVLKALLDRIDSLRREARVPQTKGQAVTAAGRFV